MPWKLNPSQEPEKSRRRTPALGQSFSILRGVVKLRSPRLLAEFVLFVFETEPARREKDDSTQWVPKLLTQSKTRGLSITAYAPQSVALLPPSYVASTHAVFSADGPAQGAVIRRTVPRAEGSLGFRGTPARSPVFENWKRPGIGRKLVRTSFRNWRRSGQRLLAKCFSGSAKTGARRSRNCRVTPTPFLFQSDTTD